MRILKAGLSINVTNMNKKKLIEFENEIAKLFNKAKIKSPIHLHSNNENYLLMLCSRNSEIDDNTLETVKNKIFNTRINKIGNAYIQELKGEAFINIK